MKQIALIAYDSMKDEMVALVMRRRDDMMGYCLVATDATGEVIEREIGMQVSRLPSDVRSRDQQLGELVSTGEIEAIIFLHDPLIAHSKDDDIAALMLICDLHNVPFATNVATAEIILTNLHTDVVASRTRVPNSPSAAYRTRSVLPETLAIASLGCVDLMSTMYLLAMGQAIEGNPLMLAVQARIGVPGMMIGKGLLLGGPLAIAEYARAHNERFVRNALRLTFVIYAGALLAAFLRGV